MTPADARLEEARTGRPATDLRRPCGRSSGSAPPLLAHACRMRSLRCSELHPNIDHLDRRISRRGFSAEPKLPPGRAGLGTLRLQHDDQQTEAACADCGAPYRSVIGVIYE